MKNKYYVVKVGHHPGVYKSVEKYRKELVGYSGSRGKGFPTLEEAQKYFFENKKKVKKEKITIQAYVDGSYSSNHKTYGYGCFIIENQQIVKKIKNSGRIDEFTKFANMSGKLFGATEAILYAIAHGHKSIKLHYDCDAIEKLYNSKIQAKNLLSKIYIFLMDRFGQYIHIEFKKVKAHSGNKYNNMADILAKQAIN